MCAIVVMYYYDTTIPNNGKERSDPDENQGMEEEDTDDEEYSEEYYYNTNMKDSGPNQHQGMTLEKFSNVEDEETKSEDGRTYDNLDGKQDPMVRTLVKSRSIPNQGQQRKEMLVELSNIMQSRSAKDVNEGSTSKNPIYDTLDDQVTDTLPCKKGQSYSTLNEGKQSKEMVEQLRDRMDVCSTKDMPEANPTGTHIYDTLDDDKHRRQNDHIYDTLDVNNEKKEKETPLMARIGKNEAVSSSFMRANFPNDNDGQEPDHNCDNLVGNNRIMRQSSSNNEGIEDKQKVPDQNVPKDRPGKKTSKAKIVLRIFLCILLVLISAAATCAVIFFLIPGIDLFIFFNNFK